MGNYNFEVKDVDEKFDARVAELKISNKSIATPTKTIGVDYSNLIKENFIRIDSKTIQDIDSPRGTLMGLAKKYNPSSINTVIPEIVETSISEKEIGMIESMIHPHTDLLITPKWSGILRTREENAVERYWDLTKTYIEESKIVNGKPLMGTIPLNLPLISIEQLIDRFIDEDVCYFLLDYGSAGARSKAGYVRNIVKKLEKDGIRDESLLYSTNMRKTHDYQNIKPADNLLTFSEGIDVIGNYHMSGRGSKDNTFKKFNPEAWSYEKTPMYPGYVYSIENNNDHQGINKELSKVRLAVQEDRTSYHILRNKTGAKEYLLDYSQATLPDFIPEWKKSFGFH